MHMQHEGDRVAAEAWGPGAEWRLERLPALLGLDDRPESFLPPAGIVRDLHRRSPGLHIGRTHLVFEALLPTILGQKVTGKQAGDGYRGLVRRYGRPAPGDVGLRMAPPPSVVGSLSYADLHPFGIERKRAVTLIEAARRVHRLEETVTMDYAAADRRLQAIRGIGPWSSGFVRGIALGDPDAVPVGDYHIPNSVAWVLAGEPRGSDERMLELLEPYRGHRRRVLLLVSRFKAPRYGPRMAVRTIADQ